MRRFCFSLFLATALGATSSLAGAQATSGGPVSPINLRVVDVGGGAVLLQQAIERYQEKNPHVTFTFTKALAPELPGAIKAGPVADLVLGGGDILAAGIDQQLWRPVLPDHASKFPNLMANYLTEARRMQELARDQAVTVTYMFGGPLLEYNPDKVPTPPTTPAELLAWCQKNPGRFTYARPANSGPGRSFLMGLPYLLSDRDPKDPVIGWEKTWAYLSQLDLCSAPYTAGTGALMKAMGAQQVDMTPITTGWDINQRALGVLPKGYRVVMMQNTTWISDALYLMVPKNIAADRAEVAMDVIAHVLKRNQQALTYDHGYFYPGPAVKNTPLVMAPAESQTAIRSFGRPEYTVWALERPHAQPLSAVNLVKALQIWDERIGAKKSPPLIR